MFLGATDADPSTEDKPPQDEPQVASAQPAGESERDTGGAALGSSDEELADSSAHPTGPGGHPSGMPGDPSRTAMIARMIRVDHAGEYGARRIYQGQLDVLHSSPAAPIIRHMAEQEQRHLDIFHTMLVERNVPPTLFMPLWYHAGYLLGVGTALMGEQAAMACTVAVEDLIDEHYARQAAMLGDQDPELSARIEQFRAEEIEHKEIALDNKAEQAPGYPLLFTAIKTASRVAIWLSERF